MQERHGGFVVTSSTRTHQDRCTLLTSGPIKLTATACAMLVTSTLLTYDSASLVGVHTYSCCTWLQYSVSQVQSDRYYTTAGGFDRVALSPPTATNNSYRVCLHQADVFTCGSCLLPALPSHSAAQLRRCPGHRSVAAQLDWPLQTLPDCHCCQRWC